ncbi:glycosyltransferase family 2 protein [Kineothrix sp. MB12-C1]|uniref:glycosyltransferase family 2 protein n=1 Tax=Kineothrix sp. MB12-C1 TaxID=3070215 RepID=UPI0027D24DD2|nr:glycosyltransferase [Kineothrix sp. MB12-C1]WMC91771.1 glycosyltransferase [Kineothrix sp. MB12-C1]
MEKCEKMRSAIIKVSNLKKTFYYLKKNGIKNAYYAVLERIGREKAAAYSYQEPEAHVLRTQRRESEELPYTFSILVPAYETNASYLREMVDSVLAQTYSQFELIIADASRSPEVQKVIEAYKDERIRYTRLKENKGISENTNAALEIARGEYIGLLDHDDVLTPDALYEMAAAIEEAKREGKEAWMLYSDEDKGNGDCTVFYDPHVKPSLNVDLLLSNNYICHFLVMKKELMQDLKFRAKYDGAQDFDLVLRAVGKLLYENGENGKKRESIRHIPKVLYHWRCHTGSTAENPESKRYAYDAGKRAVEDFIAKRGWKGKVEHTLHLGFYRINYEGGIFAQRSDVGIIGGKVLDSRKRIVGAIYDKKGNNSYEGLHKEYSGYMHRASLSQEAYAVDIRGIKVRRELQGLFEEIMGVPYLEDPVTGLFAYQSCGKVLEPRQQSMNLCQKMRQVGYTIVFTPEITTVLKGKV